jgi:hypothetical protein
MQTEPIHSRDSARRSNDRRIKQAESLPFTDRRTGDDRRSGEDRRVRGNRDSQA